MTIEAPNPTGVNLEVLRPDLATIRMLHTHVVTESILEMIRRGITSTLELDISSGPDGPYIGQHELYYRHRGLAFPPANVSIKRAMGVVAEHNIFVKFDCKDEGAIPEILQLVKTYQFSPNQFMLHVHAKEFDFQKERRELHWVHENIPLELALELRRNASGPGLQVSCRGFTPDTIQGSRSEQAGNLFKVCEKTKENGIEIVNLSLPGNQIPPDWVLNYFYHHDILLEVYEANIGGRELPCDVFTTTEVNTSG